MERGWRGLLTPPRSAGEGGRGGPPASIYIRGHDEIGRGGPLPQGAGCVLSCSPDHGEGRSARPRVGHGDRRRRSNPGSRRLVCGVGRGNRASASRAAWECPPDCGGRVARVSSRTSSSPRPSNLAAWIRLKAPELERRLEEGREGRAVPSGTFPAANASAIPAAPWSAAPSASEPSARPRASCLPPVLRHA
jgi:hypothetical protein